MLEPKPFHRRQQHAQHDRLPMWVVCNPTTADYPGQWVARMHLTFPTPEPTNLVIVADSLGDVRAQLPEGMTNIGRQDGDDPVIAEVWI
jgi:hypothetical protein